MKAILAALLLTLALSQGLILKENEPPKLDLNDIKELLRGIFESWKANQEEVEELLKCVESITDIETEIGKIIEELKKIDPRDVRKLADIVVKLIEAVQKIFADIKFCFRSGSEIWNMVKRVLKLNPIEMLIKILGNIRVNGEILWEDIIGMLHAFKEANFYKFGYCLGELMDLMIFKAKPQ